MKKRYKKISKIKVKFVTLSSLKKTFCGFNLIEKNHNQLWKWDTLENIKI